MWYYMVLCGVKSYCIVLCVMMYYEVIGYECLSCEAEGKGKICYTNMLCCAIIQYDAM
jgi:hypothetical protein